MNPFSFTAATRVRLPYGTPTFLSIRRIRLSTQPPPRKAPRKRTSCASWFGLVTRLVVSQKGEYSTRCNSPSPGFPKNSGISMKEKSRTRLIQAVRSKARSRSIISCPLAMLLCFSFVVLGIIFLSEGNFRVGAAQKEQNGGAKISLPVMNLHRLVSFGHAPAKSGPYEDHIWHERKRVGTRKSVAEIGATPNFYRALSLDEIAQREMLRHAPMEFSKVARQTQLIMSLPMPNGTLARFRIEESPVMAPRLAALRLPVTRLPPAAESQCDFSPSTRYRSERVRMSEIWGRGRCR